MDFGDNGFELAPTEVEKDRKEKRDKQKLSLLLQSAPSLARIITAKSQSQIDDALSFVSSIQEQAKQRRAQQEENTEARKQQLTVQDRENKFRIKLKNREIEATESEREKDRIQQSKIIQIEEFGKNKRLEREAEIQSELQKTRLEFEAKQKKLGFTRTKALKEQEFGEGLALEFIRSGVRPDLSRSLGSRIASGAGFDELPDEEKLALHAWNNNRKAQNQSDQTKGILELLTIGLDFKVPDIQDDGSQRRDPLTRKPLERRATPAEILGVLTNPAGILEGFSKLPNPGEVNVSPRGEETERAVSDVEKDRLDVLINTITEDKNLQDSISNLNTTEGNVQLFATDLFDSVQRFTSKELGANIADPKLQEARDVTISVIERLNLPDDVKSLMREIVETNFIERIQQQENSLRAL